MLDTADKSHNPDIVAIMMRCWSEMPGDRPEFSGVRGELRRVNKEYGGSNILDNLLSRMERYADNLETAVKERTQDYLEEKKGEKRKDNQSKHSYRNVKLCKAKLDP